MRSWRAPIRLGSLGQQAVGEKKNELDAVAGLLMAERPFHYHERMASALSIIVMASEARRISLASDCHWRVAPFPLSSASRPFVHWHGGEPSHCSISHVRGPFPSVMAAPAFHCHGERPFGRIVRCAGIHHVRALFHCHGERPFHCHGERPFHCHCERSAAISLAKEAPPCRRDRRVVSLPAVTNWAPVGDTSPLALLRTYAL